MPHFFTFTGHAELQPLPGRLDGLNDPITPKNEHEWLLRHPRQVARVRRVEVDLEAGFDLTMPVFLFSVRLLDPRTEEGWCVAMMYLRAVAPSDAKGEKTLDDAWPEAKGDPAKENDFVLNALTEAVYECENGAQTILHLLVLPDTSLLDPQDWGQDFTPYKHRT